MVQAPWMPLCGVSDVTDSERLHLPAHLSAIVKDLEQVVEEKEIWTEGQHSVT